MSDHWLYTHLTGSLIDGVPKYDVILADPPWSYRDKARAGKRGSEYKYKCMHLDLVKALPVKKLANDDSLLFLWSTMPMLPNALRVMQVWGFAYKTMAFTWVKTTKNGKLAWGMGNWTRSNPELCLLGVRGKPKRVSAGVHSVVMSERGEYSEKPKEVNHRIDQLCGNVDKIELFARKKTPGWDVWGDEIDSDVKVIYDIL